MPQFNQQLPGAMQGSPRSTQPVAQTAPTDGMMGAGGGGMPAGSSNSNPLQPFYMQNPPMGQATMFGGAQLPDWMQSFLSPNSTIQQILQGFAPQAQQATRSLNDTLAAGGISGGPAAGLQTQLQGQLASSLAPTLANAIQGSQGNELQAALANAGFTQQAGMANMGAANQMTGMNINNIMQQMMANTGYANQGQNELAQALMNAYGMNFNAFNNLNNAGLQGAMNLGSQNLANAGSLANQEANNFPVYQSMWPSLLGAAGQAASAGAFG